MKTTKEMIEVMEAFSNGAIIEFKNIDLYGEVWFPAPHPLSGIGINIRESWWQHRASFLLIKLI